MLETECVVIGSGFSGHLMSYLLAQRGQTVTLLEAQKQPGGLCRVDWTEELPIDFGLNVNPLSQTEISSLGWPVEWLHVKTEGPLCFQKKEWLSADEGMLSKEQKHFLTTTHHWPQGGWGRLCERMVDRSAVSVKTGVPVTDIVQAEGQFKVESNDTSWLAKHVVLSLPASDVLFLMSKDRLTPSFLKGWKKVERAACVKLDFIHDKKIFDKQEILFSIEENGVGLFPSNIDASLTDQGKTISQWIFFLSDEERTNKEEVAKRMRAGKRFLKKAFPDFFDHVLWERISVIPNLFPLNDAFVGETAPISKLPQCHWMHRDQALFNHQKGLSEMLAVIEKISV